MNLRLPRWLAASLLVLAALMMMVVTQDAEARRMGGGFNLGRQSTNVLKQRQAVTPPAARTPQRSATPAAGAAAAGGAAAKSGLSRWIAPLAGIAAGLGIAALLSSLGLSGLFLELLSSALLIGLVIFAIMFVLRRLRGPDGSLAPAAGGPQSGPQRRQAWAGDSSMPAARSATGGAAPVIEAVASRQAPEADWFIPGDFDVPAFLEQAKRQFIHIQSLWDAGDRDGLQALVTDDLLAEITPRLPAPEEGNRTDVVLLNAELLGIEAVAGGHLASVRYSGMLREQAGAEASRFEEVWNLYKEADAGWLLAGIQQLDGH